MDNVCTAYEEGSLIQKDSFCSSSPGLLLGIEAPAMTPNGANFSFLFLPVLFVLEGHALDVTAPDPPPVVGMALP